MKIMTTFLLAALCILGCSNHNDGTSESNASDTSTELTLSAGGIYASKNEAGKYTLTKILALDAETVHARFYNEEFDELPTEVSSGDLTFLLGHAPLARKGFLAEHRDLVTVEDVSESELEGYKIYLEAMQGN